MTAPGDEFDIIARYFAPLAAPEGRGLLDDAAFAELEGPHVFTADTIVEGVHFLADDPIETVAQKALRVNLSDLAAKGAKPLGYLVNLAWPRGRDPELIMRFAAGLGADQAQFRVKLWGGDTTSTTGPLVVSVTAIGKSLSPCAPDRAGARPGDDIWVTGVIGDGLLGLMAAQGRAPSSLDPYTAALIAHYRTPPPRLDWADLVARWATASMDVSDGLLADAAKLAAASQAQLTLNIDAVPLSPAGATFITDHGDRSAALQALCAGGDDYQILFATPPGARAVIERRTGPGGPVLIGHVSEGAGLRLVNASDAELHWPAAGHVHRLGG